MAQRIKNAQEMKRNGKSYVVTLYRPSGEVELPVRRLSIAERERLDADYPEPFPPKIVRGDGLPALDTADKDYLTALAECHRKRREVRVASALGAEFFGTAVLSDQIRMLREELDFSVEDLINLENQIRNPMELTPLAVEVAAERLSPTEPTAVGG